MSTYGLTMRIEAMEKRLTAIADELGIGEESEGMKALKREVQNLRERVEVLESDTVDTIETKTADGTHTRHIPKRRARKPLQLSA